MGSNGGSLDDVYTLLVEVMPEMAVARSIEAVTFSGTDDEPACFSGAATL